MTNSDFWASIYSVINDGFNPEGLAKLEEYAENFISGRLVYQRFSPLEQHGCIEGGSTHVIASLLAGADVTADKLTAPLGSFQRDQQARHIHQQRRFPRLRAIPHSIVVTVNKQESVNPLQGSRFFVQHFSRNTFVRYYFLVFLYRPHAESGVIATGEAIRKEFFMAVWDTIYIKRRISRAMFLTH